MWRLVAGAVSVAAAMAASAAQADEKKAPPKSIWEQETLTGDWGGARTALKGKSGIDISLSYINEVLGCSARRHQSPRELRRPARSLGRHRSRQADRLGWRVNARHRLSNPQFAR
jgi:hypothetical protein